VLTSAAAAAASSACYGLQDSAGHHSSALFVQWVPYQLAGSSWEAEEERYTQHLLDIVDTFAPGATAAAATAALLIL
jgi:phytoene dehydrogenase-like protein